MAWARASTCSFRSDLMPDLDLFFLARALMAGGVSPAALADSMRMSEAFLRIARAGVAVSLESLFRS